MPQFIKHQSGLVIRRLVKEGSLIEYRFDRTRPDRVAVITIDTATRKKIHTAYFPTRTADEIYESYIHDKGYAELDTEPEEIGVGTIVYVDPGPGSGLDAWGCTLS